MSTAPEKTREIIHARQTSKLDVARIRHDFPVLDQTVRGKPLAYLDNAATSQKPRSVIDAMTNYYTRTNANVHRGVHMLSQGATAAYEGARERIKGFINAASEREIVFVRGATEAINLVAQSYGRANIGRGDEIIISAMEHHSNIVPWQLLCEQTGAVLKVIPITDSGELIMSEYEKLIGPKTRMVGIGHVSNALGTINPIGEIIDLAHAHDVPVLVDGAQATPHMAVDVRALDCDFYAFSSHKMFGPTGLGVLYTRESLLAEMPPWQGGGDMIRMVSFEKTLYNDLPYRFEAGTPNIVGAVGLGAAIDYLQTIGLQNIATYEDDLLRYATARVQEVPGLRVIGTAPYKAGVLSFVLEGVHPHDLGTILDNEGVAVRAGHHCAMPVMERFGIPATTRASFAFYNTFEEADALVAALHNAREVFA